jgi:hypothetical protein
MAFSRFTNTDFINTFGSVNDLVTALETTATTRRKGVRISGASKETAQTNLENDVRNLLLSSLRKLQPSGYGALPLDAVQPVRELHTAVSKFLSREQAPNDDDDDDDDDDGEGEGDEEGAEEREEEEGSFADVQRRLATLVGVIDPDHPLIREGEEEKTDENVEDGAAEDTKGSKKPEKKKKKKKAPTKQTKMSVKKKGKQRVGVVQTPAGKTIILPPPQLLRCCTDQS